MKEKSLDQITIYQIFPRNFHKSGKFRGIIESLDYIKSLGVDIIYLLPIHEIGKEGRKGTYGSPYAIKDYFSISEDLGTKDDFIELINECHKRDLKLIMDMVFNHTSIDSVLVKEHPEFYDYNSNNERYNKCGGWLDVVDLNTHRKDTQDYLLSVIKYWSNLGVDGFRFDVANFIDENIYKRIREEIDKPLFLLAESVHMEFRDSMLKRGIYCLDDITLAKYFDCLYNYNTILPLEFYLDGKLNTLRPYKYRLKEQEKYMPSNYNRITCLENHDLPRIASRAKDITQLENLIAYSFLYKGSSFLYAGEELGLAHRPELFEKDPLDPTLANKDVLDFTKRLISLKKLDYFYEYKNFKILDTPEDILGFTFNSINNDTLICIFNFHNDAKSIKLDTGFYYDLLNNKTLKIDSNYINITKPLILVRK